MQVFRNIKPIADDDRGMITDLIPKGVDIKSVMRITSKAGTIRSNHYHKQDTHYCYLESGRAEWYEKPVSGNAEMEKETLDPGDMVYTPAMTVHAVKFLEDSVLWAFSAFGRENQEAYENDTVRLTLI